MYEAEQEERRPTRPLTEKEIRKISGK